MEERIKALEEQVEFLQDKLLEIGENYKVYRLYMSYCEIRKTSETDMPDMSTNFLHYEMGLMSASDFVDQCTEAVNKYTIGVLSKVFGVDIDEHQ